MGGGPTGGSFSSSDMTRLEQQAESRLRQVMGDPKRVLFVCETIDRSSLETRLGKAFPGKSFRMLDSSDTNDISAVVAGAGLVVVYTEEASQTGFLDDVVEAADAQTTEGIHVKGATDAKVPAKVSSYRWRSISWDKLVEFMR